MEQVGAQTETKCYHCGEDCTSEIIHAYDKTFCCAGCKMVYGILAESNLCEYYEINQAPGINQRQAVRENKFSFLDDISIAQKLISFKDEERTHVTFYLPQIHCSSCLWLLENLHKLNNNVISSTVNFARKEVEVIFLHGKVSLKKVAELLTAVGYEPYISLQNITASKPKVNRDKLYKLGVAGFCFANIMLLSFPEYLGVDAKEQGLLQVFRWINVILSLPVFFYSATEFYQSAWKSLKHGFLNIDAPIVLAIIVTFCRSIYEVLTQTGGGYFDSMSGIVFFMLVGRVLQNRTYDHLNFERDYTAYFPVAVTLIKDNKEQAIALPDIKLNDTLLIHSQELIPADGILTRGKALIDYSFVTGESMPVEKEMGEIVYAGGKQLSGNIEILVVKEVSQSYLTRLWNRDELKQKKNDETKSFVHFLSKYFTVIVLTIAFSGALYWFFRDKSVMWNAFTAVLIVACPCALLLCNTFTNGNILRILSNRKLYLRNAQTIEDIANVDLVVFDKTGTLTTGSFFDIQYDGRPLTEEIKQKIALLASQSVHPMSKSIAALYPRRNTGEVVAFTEVAGKGIEGIIQGDLVTLGSREYVTGSTEKDFDSGVYVAIEGSLLGKFSFKNHYRENVASLIQRLQKRYPIAILSGDNESEKRYLKLLLGENADTYFNQKPEDKLAFIKKKQAEGHKVMMIGDGLNDAGALKQADAGISVTEDSNNFTPASDAILEAKELNNLPRFIAFCKANGVIIMIAFIISILYNIAGIYFAVTGRLSPMIAAILMPFSSISILLITFGLSNLLAKKVFRNAGTN